MLNTLKENLSFIYVLYSSSTGTGTVTGTSFFFGKICVFVFKQGTSGTSTTTLLIQRP